MSISIPQADFTPQLTGYTGQGAFRFWCQKVLPIVYDDSLSYYELLNKVVNYLNNVIADFAGVENNIEALDNSYLSLQTYVNDHMQELVEEVNTFTTFVENYFANLDVQEEINNKLDDMAGDGSLSRLLAPIIAITAPDVITQWLNGHITPTSPPVDDTLTISRAAADAKVTGDRLTALKYWSIDLYTGATPANSVNELPLNCFMVRQGSVMKPLLGENFTWTLSNTTSYILHVYRITDTAKRFTLSSLGGPIYWFGDSISDSTIEWYTSRPDTTLKNSGVPADAKIVGDSIYKKYTGANPVNSVEELPDNCWWVSPYTMNLVPLLGENFVWNLQSGYNYIVKVRRVTSTYRRYELSSISGDVYWTGGKANSDANITWRTTLPDKTLSVSGVPGDAKATGNQLSRLVEDNDNNAVEVYTELGSSPGWWNLTGNLAYLDTQAHSDKLQIRPNTQYYLGYFVSGNSCYGAFFDSSGNFLSPLRNADITQYEYTKPDPTATYGPYVWLYTFTSPEGAYYFSYNMSNAETNVYRNYVASKPIFGLSDTGNYVIKKNDSIYQKFKNRKLCVIGPSTVMIDRLKRNGTFNNPGPSSSQHIVGFQEYLIPWWNTVDSYGYSGASYRKYDEEDGSSYRSIYSRIVIDNLDLSEYDDYLLCPSGNSVRGHIGSLSSYSDLGDATTYMGGLRRIVDYIYTQNPKAKIYVQTMRYQGAWATDRSVIDELNLRIREMGEMLSIPVIDSAYECGINQYNSDIFSYDNGEHYNQIGSMVQGLYIRKEILGI